MIWEASEAMTLHLRTLSLHIIHYICTWIYIDTYIWFRGVREWWIYYLILCSSWFVELTLRCQSKTMVRWLFIGEKWRLCYYIYITCIYLFSSSNSDFMPLLFFGVFEFSTYLSWNYFVYFLADNIFEFNIYFNLHPFNRAPSKLGANCNR